MNWLAATIIGLIVLWVGVAAWRMVVFVGRDMAESWSLNETYTPELFYNAIGAGILEGIFFPLVAPVKALGNLIWRVAEDYAHKVYERTKAAVEQDKALTFTGELAKIPGRALAAGGYDVAGTESTATSNEASFDPDTYGRHAKKDDDTQVLPLDPDATVYIPRHFPKHR